MYCMPLIFTHNVKLIDIQLQGEVTDTDYFLNITYDINALLAL